MASVPSVRHGGWLESCTKASSTRGFCSGLQNQIAVISLRILFEARESVGLDGDGSARGDVEIATVGEDRVEHAGQVPGRPVVRRRVAADVRLGEGMMPHIAIVALDAHGRVGQGDPDLEAADKPWPSAIGRLNKRELAMSLTTLYSR